jgi:DNA invertase Pin-like site-specific DNA recombinase
MVRRAGIYDRVSDDQGGRSRSTEQQGTDNQTAADSEGWSVVARYQEPDRSASRFARKPRPEWDRLLADVKAGRLDAVVLWEPSRGDRKLTGWSGFLDLCRERGVLVHVTSHRHTYDLTNARDWRSLAEDGVDSAWESEKTSLRIRRDMADAAARGIPHGRLAYGYSRRYDPVTRELVAQEPHSEQAPVVREIIGRIAAGEAISVLVSDLTARGVPTPTGGSRWARSTVQRIVLAGVCYIGKRRHNGSPLLDGNWPALVDKETYWRAVAVLSDPARKKAADRRGGIRPGAAKWLLSYVARCGKCGAPLSVQYRESAYPFSMQYRMRDGKREVPFYRCSSSAGGCAVAPVEWLDGVVAGEIVRYLAEPGRYKPEGSDKEAQRYRDEAAAERARLAEFEAEAKAGRISAASFARIAGGIEERIGELDARANEASADSAVSPLLAARGNDPRALTAHRRLHMLVRWEEMPLAAQRRAVRVLAEPTLAPTGRGGDPLSPNRLSMNFKAA